MKGAQGNLLSALFPPPVAAIATDLWWRSHFKKEGSPLTAPLDRSSPIGNRGVPAAWRPASGLRRNTGPSLSEARVTEDTRSVRRKKKESGRLWREEISDERCNVAR